ncbi:uncharacterized protein LOC134549485 isoform X3 [Prinia subflava]|uniref:uncharacterized protein LOC134549485 isoform X3 n=1 Tax=Prinia subflava TaxID=208062 RepID=UPI002FE3735D
MELVAEPDACSKAELRQVPVAPPFKTGGAVGGATTNMAAQQEVVSATNKMAAGSRGSHLMPCSRWRLGSLRRTEVFGWMERKGNTREKLLLVSSESSGKSPREILAAGGILVSPLERMPASAHTCCFAARSLHAFCCRFGSQELEMPGFLRGFPRFSYLAGAAR